MYQEKEELPKDYFIERLASERKTELIYSSFIEKKGESSIQQFNWNSNQE